MLISTTRLEVYTVLCIVCIAFGSSEGWGWKSKTVESAKLSLLGWNS